MSDTPTPSATPSQALLGPDWYKDPPGGDLTLDQLFPNPETTPQQPAPAPSATPQAPPTPSGPFIKTATGTVYNTAEDAVKGIEEKDRIIAKLRQDKAAETGVDPLKRQQAQDPASYMQSPERFFDDVVASATKGDKRGYAETFARFQQELLQPYAPLIGEMARERAVRVVEQQIPTARGFFDSPEFQNTLERTPNLRQAIEMASLNPQMAGSLPELFELAYKSALADRMPALVQAAAQAASQPTPNPRPTLTPSTPTLSPAPTPGPANLETPEGRKAILERGKSKGFENVSWGEVGL